ncbi:MAG: hypothetical protein FD130_1973 [Halothiobacillaceae bacterium]|nr:MAG: hypothetical protein FD130_1973 [Halothiobacillaceae bacterium]
MRRIAVTTLTLLAVLPTEPLLACATCLAGDPTITTMGTEKPFAGRKRLSIDYLSRSETVGQPNVNEHKIDEERITYSFSYAFSDAWIAAASLPLIDKEVERYDLSHEKASGPGDLDLSLRWFIGKDERFPARQLWGTQFGVRLPTSTEEQSQGEAIDFDAQPGAGATIPNLGLWFGYYRTPWFLYSSFQWQHALDDGYQGYQAGDALLLTGLVQYAPLHRLAVQFSLDGRWKAQDSYYDRTDDNSGGLLVMASPGVAWTPLDNLVVNLLYQHPAIERMHGRQDEDSTLRLGVTYDF